MTNAVRCLCGGLLVLIGLTSVMLAAESPGLQIGVAETDITPPTGFLVAGYYHERQATGTLNPLKARALVFGQGSQRVAFVACDVIGIARDLSCEVRRRAAAQTGIPETHIVLAATHSHTAPEYTRDLYQYLGESAPERESRYAARLIGGIVEAIVQVAQLVGQRRVVMTGGCFQNKFLLQRAVERLQQQGFRPYWHQRIPPNDGGIALGQVIAASRRLAGSGPQNKGVKNVPGCSREDPEH